MFRLVRSRQALEREGVTVIDRAHPLDRLGLAENVRLGGGVVEVVAACDFEPVGMLGDQLERPEPFRSRDAERLEIGRASCREGMCQYVWISVDAIRLINTTLIQKSINVLITI